MEQSDSECISHCLAGKRDAYRLLVERYQRPLMALVRGGGATPQMAEEILQETFVRGYVNLSRLGKRESFFPWLIGISQRVAKEARKNNLIKNARRIVVLPMGIVCRTPRSSNEFGGSISPFRLR